MSPASAGTVVAVVVEANHTLVVAEGVDDPSKVVAIKAAVVEVVSPNMVAGAAEAAVADMQIPTPLTLPLRNGQG
jgi:hypothetical protein